MNKEMYFIRVIPTNMPKNNLHKQIDKEIGQLCHLLNSDVEALVDNIKRSVSKLNELHPRCRAATVSHTRPLKNDENATHLIFISCKDWYVNIHLTLVRGVFSDEEQLTSKHYE